MRLAIIIPAFNEEPVIGDVVNSLPSFMIGVEEIIPIVIDDGSRDDTALMATKAGAVVLRHPINLGVGSATQTGFIAARKLAVDLTVTMDADGQHSAENLAVLVQPILNGQVDVVFGNRFINLASMPLNRRFGNRLLSFITFMAAGINIADSQCGFRAYSKKALESIILHQRGYEVCSEIIYEVSRCKLKFTQIPVNTIYNKFTHKKSQDFSNAFNIIQRILERAIWN